MALVRNSSTLGDVSSTGHFERKPSRFRRVVVAQGDDVDSFSAEPGRYHLYVSLACPWAHRTLIVRKLKGLDDVISVNVVHWHMDKLGWRFLDGEEPCEGATMDDVTHAKRLRDIYFAMDPDYDGRFTVPVLYDKKTRQIVNNESSEILRMLNSEFNQWARNPTLDLYPKHLREAIDCANEWIYREINNGVYRCGFARTQAAYNEAATVHFKAMDRLEDLLGKTRYLTGETITEADIRLFTTLIRYDAVYVGHFKCNQQRVYDRPHTREYAKELYQIPEIKETVNFTHIKSHYYGSHESINPTLIIPMGPDLSYLDAPHTRGKL